MRLPITGRVLRSVAVPSSRGPRPRAMGTRPAIIRRLTPPSGVFVSQPAFDLLSSHRLGGILVFWSFGFLVLAKRVDGKFLAHSSLVSTIFFLALK